MIAYQVPPEGYRDGVSGATNGSAVEGRILQEPLFDYVLRIRSVLRSETAILFRIYKEQAND